MTETPQDQPENDPQATPAQPEQPTPTTAGEADAIPAQAPQFSLQRGDDEYESEDLQHLSDMEHVRKRPAMYIGDITGRGLHHLVYEVVDNSIDEAMAGFAKNISVDRQQRRFGDRRR